jgi:hypothetical protein
MPRAGRLIIFSIKLPYFLLHPGLRRQGHNCSFCGFCVIAPAEEGGNQLSICNAAEIFQRSIIPALVQKCMGGWEMPSLLCL